MCKTVLSLLSCLALYLRVNPYEIVFINVCAHTVGKLIVCAAGPMQSEHHGARRLARTSARNIYSNFTFLARQTFFAIKCTRALKLAWTAFVIGFEKTISARSVRGIIWVQTDSRVRAAVLKTVNLIYLLNMRIFAPALAKIWLPATVKRTTSKKKQKMSSTNDVPFKTFSS